MRQSLIIVFLAALAFHAAPPSVHAEVTGGIEFSHDSDDADMYGVYLGYRYPLGRPRSGSGIGARAGHLTFKDPNGKERFRVLEVSHVSEPMKGSHLDLTGKWLSGDWSPWLYSGNFSYRPGDRWYIELFSERGVVDSVTSIQMEYLMDTNGFSVDYGLSDEFTLVGALFAQDITDGNRRIGTVGRVVYTPRARDWLNLQVKARLVDSEFNGIGYFSPELLSEYYFLIGAARPFADDNWVVRGLIGPGLQVIDQHNGSSETKPAFLVEGKLKGWFTPEFGMNGRLGYTNAQKTGGSDRYLYGEVNLVHMW